MSDDEDNSWADELTEIAAEDEYGEEFDDAEDYGEEASPQAHGLEEVSVQLHESDVKAQEEEEVKPKKQTKPTINVYCTEYDVVKKVAKKVNNFKLVEIDEDHEGGIHKGVGAGKLSTQWDITWHDLAITPDFLAKLEPY